MLMIFLLIQATVNSDELKQGIDAFNQGYYRIAESYFSHIANEKTFKPEAIDARYYLSRIYEARNELISQISATDFFLQEYPYEKRTSELFDRLVRKFVDIGSFSLAYEYLKNYDYLKVDSTLFWDIAIGLIELKRDRLADFMLAAMGQTDTVLILRANIADSTVAKERFYQAMSGPEKYIFLTELALDSGDTLKAYDAFLTLDNKEFGQEMKFHYARLGLFFDRANAENYIDQLDNASMLNKKMLLTALYKGKTVKLEPRDDDEYDLFILCLNQEIAPRCSLGIVDSIGNSDIMITNLDSLRKVYGSCFLFDSIYCETLLNLGAYIQALQLIEPYRNYVNTQHFFHKVRGQYYFYKQDYRRSAIDLILAGELSPKLNLLLARSLNNTGRNAYSFYESILNISKDSLILAEANRDLLSLLFKDREFDRVLEIMPDSETGDTALMRIKICSLAGIGKIGIAESLAVAHQIALRSQILDYYTDHLIGIKNYDRARYFLDSIITDTFQDMAAISYKWALLPFIQGDHGTALDRLQLFIQNFPEGRCYYHACFKIATILYFNQDFNQAADYYAIAAQYDSLSYDALKNQMICAKKGAHWEMAIDAGKRLITLISDAEMPELLYDIGYAYLRSGRFRLAIGHLVQSVRSHPEPASLYWLAEAYFGRGDFIRALYYYRRITDLFPTDKMWIPTSNYKTGLVLEFMDETEEAIKIYETIIRKHGAQDTWGIEAQHRLDDLR